MSRIVQKDRRFNSSSSSRKAFKLIASFKAKDIKPQTVIPDYIKSRWNANKNVLGYATFRGFTTEEAIRVFALAKGAKILLAINRYAEISGYKLSGGF